MEEKEFEELRGHIDGFLNTEKYSSKELRNICKDYTKRARELGVKAKYTFTIKDGHILLEEVELFGEETLWIPEFVFGTNRSLASLEKYSPDSFGYSIISGKVIHGSENLHTVVSSGLVNMTMLFAGLKTASLDLSKFDMSKVKEFSGAFLGCQDLEEIKGLDDWDLHKLVYGYMTFAYCHELNLRGKEE